MFSFLEGNCRMVVPNEARSFPLFLDAFTLCCDCVVALACSSNTQIACHRVLPPVAGLLWAIKRN
jgi:hypothetical protein